MIKIFAIWRLELFITNLIDLCKCSEFVKVIKNNLIEIDQKFIGVNSKKINNQLILVKKK